MLSVALSVDRALLLSESVDTTAKLWNTKDGSCKHTLAGHELNSLVIFSKTDIVITVSEDHIAMLWSIENGSCRQIFTHLYDLS